MSEFPSLVPDFDQARDTFELLVAGVALNEWTNPTPCTEWNVRQLINHVVTGNLTYAATFSGRLAPDRSQDHLGDDPARAFREATNELRDGFTAPGMLERTIPGPFGEQPGAFMVLIRIAEMVVHGWDLARATGQPAGFSEAVAERSLATVRQGLGSRPRGTTFAEEQPAPANAPAVDRLAAFLGRSL